MAGRILTLQRQARELGRLRSGYTDTGANGKARPVRSETWIITSHAEHYIRAAAEEWGGAAEPWQPQGNGAPQWRVVTEATVIDAILPPGDPLSQTYEMWSGGGCQRRCDGQTEQISDTPCLCLAQHGEAWFEKPKGQVCAATTRLNVILPQMPDFGVFRAETHSFYAANEIAATVDLIRSATGGATAVPIKLRIEQRQRLANGQTKKFPVIVVELRGQTAGQILAGHVQQVALDGAPQRHAIEAAPSGVDWRAVADAATTAGELKGVWNDAREAGQLTDALKAYITGQAQAMGAVSAPPPVPADLPDVDTLWSQVMICAPPEWKSADVEKAYEEYAGHPVEKATAEAMHGFLQHLRSVTA